MPVSEFLVKSLPLGELPKDWDVDYLSKLSTKIGSGATPKGGDQVYKSEGITFIRSQNVYDHEFHPDGLVFLDDDAANRLSNVTVEPNDVLLNITGDSIARCCRVPTEVLPARVNQHVSIIRTNSRLDSVFLQKYLSLPAVKHYMLGHDAGGTRKALTKGHIESFLIPLPPIPEQRKIAEVFQTIDDKIELNRRMNETLEAMARAIFKSWFVDFDPVRAKANGQQPPGLSAEIAGLFPNSFEDSPLGGIPAGWGVGRLEDCLILQRGFDLPTSQRVAGKYTVIAASGPSTSHNEAKVMGPGVVTGRSGVLGKVYFIQDDFWPLNTTLWVKEFRIAKPHYAYFLLQTLDLHIFNSGSAVPTLNRNHVHSLPVLLPSPKVLELFEETVSSFFLKIKQNQIESDTLTEIRDALLPKLLSGEIRVGDLNGGGTVA
jgi:type I restriction enzyme S subunit